MREDIDISYFMGIAPSLQLGIDKGNVVGTTLESLPSVETLIDRQETEIIDLRIRTLAANLGKQALHKPGNRVIGNAVADIIDTTADEYFLWFGKCNLIEAMEHTIGIIAHNSSIDNKPAGCRNPFVPFASELSKAIAEHYNIVGCYHRKMMEKCDTVAVVSR
jgi:hypothetical protein